MTPTKMAEPIDPVPGTPAEPVASSPPPSTERVMKEVLGVRFDSITNDQAVDRVLELAKSRPTSLILTPNTDHVLRARKDPDFAALCARGELVIADGMPVVWASKLLGQRLPERVAGSDLMPRSVIAAAKAGLRYFFLGGDPGDAERAAQVLAEQAGSDGLCGIDCPPFGFEKDPAYLEALVEKINQSGADLVYVGLGSPKQENLMAALQPRLDVGALMAVGVTFSFVAGTVKRAPKFFQKTGLEWFWRLACEPRRLWRRYANNLAVFPFLVLKTRLFGPRPGAG